MSKNLSELSGRKGLGHNLFEELGVAARETGTPDRQAIESLADEFLFGKANVYGTTTFYDFLRPENQGKKVYICARLPDRWHPAETRAQLEKPLFSSRNRRNVLPRPLPRKQCFSLQ